MIPLPARQLASLFVAGALALACAQRSPSTARTAPAAAISLRGTSLAAAPDHVLTTGDVRLRYRVIGTGDPVVLLHGYSRSLTDWYGLADSLAKEYQVIALDARGFGQSSRFTDPSRYGDAMVDDVVRLLDHLGVRQANVVGHSMGAVMAANLALRHPTRVRTATFAAGVFRDSLGAVQLGAPTIASLERGEGLRPLLAWLFPMLPDSVLIPIDRQAMAENDRGALLAVLRNLPFIRQKARAATLRIPTLGVVGSADPLAPDSRELATWWPGVQVIVVDGANHGDIIARPEFLAALRALVARR